MQKNPIFILKYWYQYLFLVQLSLGEKIRLHFSLLQLRIVKENVLVKQLFLDLIRFMIGWSLYISIIPEIVFSSREHVCVNKL